MKELIILSGKGGTGKTSIVGSFAAIAHNKVMADCDVDAADLHLLLRPVNIEAHDFYSGQVAVIDKQKCVECGICENTCRFDAIHDFTVEPVSCEGCGFCSRICPVEAVTMKICNAGRWYLSDTNYGKLVHARLGIAQENSGKLVALVRQQAKEYANTHNLDFIISDGPPGTGCPVISSISGANLALIVTEPTLSGIHDMERVLDVCSHFKVPAVVCVNKYDINIGNTEKIKRSCEEKGIEVAALIPFDTTVTEAMIQGKPIVEFTATKVADEIRILWETVEKKLREKK